MDKANLPFRKNVSAITYRKDKFLILQRVDWPKNWWKFPQGGIDPDETDERAIKRELEEELGTDQFRLIGKSVYTNQYDWDDESVAKAGYKWRGQDQKFFLVEFIGEDGKLKLADEIKTYKWVLRDELKRYIDVDNKNFKNYYATVQKVLEEFSNNLI